MEPTLSRLGWISILLLYFINLSCTSCPNASDSRGSWKLLCNDRCFYHSHGHGSTFYKAANECTIAEGTLAVGPTPEKMNYLANAVAENSWIGLYKEERLDASSSLDERRKGWKWTDGSIHDAEWNAWDTNMPTGMFGCVHLSKESRKWRDNINCSGILGILCEAYATNNDDCTALSTSSPTSPPPSTTTRITTLGQSATITLSSKTTLTKASTTSSSETANATTSNPPRISSDENASRIPLIISLSIICILIVVVVIIIHVVLVVFRTNSDEGSNGREPSSENHNGHEQDSDEEKREKSAVKVLPDNLYDEAETVNSESVDYELS